MRPTGIPEATGMQEEIQALLESEALLRRLPTPAEVANTAAFMASGQASAMTATVANTTCGRSLTSESIGSCTESQSDNIREEAQ